MVFLNPLKAGSLQEFSPITTIAKVFLAVMRQKSRREKITTIVFI